MERAEPGQWLRIKTAQEYNPPKRYGHSAVMYEPASANQLSNLKENLMLADIEQRIA